MNIEEFRQKDKELEDWAPGWEAIEEQLTKLYGDQNPRHYGTAMPTRAIFGGDNYLDGFSVYKSAHGHLHGVTFGMSELYASEESFGGEFSRWGYEMTIKLPDCADKEFMWAIDMLSNLARYTYTSERYFEPLQYVSGGGNPIRAGSDSHLTGLLVVADTELEGTDTLYGRLEFLQVVGITQPELDAITADRDLIETLLARLKQDNPYLITDLARTKSFL